MDKPIKLYLLATPYSSASSLYGLYDALSAAGQAWEVFVTGEAVKPLFDVKIISASLEPFRCASGSIVTPDTSIKEADRRELIIVPGMNLSAREPLGPDEQGCYQWLRDNEKAGSRVVAACTGAVYLAEAGLLDGKEATTHWVYGDLFRRFYTNVKLRLDRSICYESVSQGVVTSGGTTAWQELALFLITNYGSLQHAINTAKFWLIASRDELQAPYVSMVKVIPHADLVVQKAQVWAAENYLMAKPVSEMTDQSGLPATSFARRFRNATGYTPQKYIQTLRIEEAKHILETGDLPVADVGEQVGYEDTPFFRRLFKREAGLSPSEYRKMFGVKRFSRYT